MFMQINAEFQCQDYRESGPAFILNDFREYLIEKHMGATAVE